VNDFILSEQCSRCVGGKNLDRYCPIFEHRHRLEKNMRTSRSFFEGHCCEMRERLIEEGILHGPKYDELVGDLRLKKEEVRNWWLTK